MTVWQGGALVYTNLCVRAEQKFLISHLVPSLHGMTWFVFTFGMLLYVVWFVIPSPAPIGHFGQDAIAYAHCGTSKWRNQEIFFSCVTIHRTTKEVLFVLLFLSSATLEFPVKCAQNDVFGVLQASEAREPWISANGRAEPCKGCKEAKKGEHGPWGIESKRKQKKGLRVNNARILQ